MAGTLINRVDFYKLPGDLALYDSRSVASEDKDDAYVKQNTSGIKIISLKFGEEQITDEQFGGQPEVEGKLLVPLKEIECQGLDALDSQWRVDIGGVRYDVMNVVTTRFHKRRFRELSITFKRILTRSGKVVS